MLVLNYQYTQKGKILMKVSKKLVSCILGTVLVCQPIFLNGLDCFSMAAEAHSSHHADIHHDNSYASDYDPYYYCDGHEAHLHDGGVCPYSLSASSDSGAYAYGYEQGSESSQSTIMDMSGKSVELSTGDTIVLSSDLICIVQDILNQKGYDCGNPDGVVGTKTKEAIADYLAQENDEDTDSLIIAMIAKGLGIQ